MTPLDADLLRDLSARATDLIARYWGSLESLPVTPPTRPGDVLQALPERAPEEGLGGAWDAVFADLERVVLPHLAHWQHPHFYAFFPANISTPAVVGELLSAGLGVQGMLWATSPACTELEVRVLDWLAEAMGLPPAMRSTSTGGGVIQGTASEATLTALVAARSRARRALRAAGASPAAHLTLYTSAQAHSSVVKAAMVAGLAEGPEDREHVRLIDVDPRTHAMRPERLGAAIREDLAAGRVPVWVCATMGTTASTAIDPIDRVADAIDAACAGWGGPRPWLHVDGAHAGACLICPELRAMAAGMERADSFCMNPHKWLLTNFDCDCFYVADRRALTDAMSITPDYLRNEASASGAVTDYRDWHVPLGRRFRSLKLWLVLRHFGLEALRGYVREHNRLAAWVEGRVRATPTLELAAPRAMNLVCFRVARSAGGSDRAERLTKDLIARLNASGRLHLTMASLPDPEEGGRPRAAVRVCVGASTTRERHVRTAWGWVEEELARVLSA